MVDLRTLVLVAALATAGVAVSSATASAAEDTVEREELEGHILLDPGRKEKGGMILDGPGVGKDEWPRGTVEVPEEADRGHWALTVDQSGDSRLRLTLCSGPCNGTGNDTRIVARDTGVRGLNAWIDVSSLEEVGWNVRSVGEPARDARVEGEARLHSTADADPSPDAREVSPTARDASEGVGWTAGALGLGLTGLAAVAWPRLRRWFTGPLVGLYHRIDRDELLEHPTRERIYEIAGEDPGIHFAELRRRTDTARGNLDHHLRRMVDEGLLEERSLAGYRCVFQRGRVPEDVMRAAGCVRSKTARRVLAAVARSPGATAAALARSLDVARSTVSYHVGSLVEAGLVDREPEGASTRLRATDLGRRLADGVAVRR